MRPLLLLDVDGVLNPFPECPPGYDEYDFFPEDDEPVRLAAAHGEWLCELATIFELAWATGWEDDANRFLCPHFGLPELAVVAMPPIPFEPHEKLPAVAAFVGDRPAAWVDDLLGLEVQEWADGRSPPTLLVHVDSAVGLTREDVAALLDWARGLRVESS